MIPMFHKLKSKLDLPFSDAHLNSIPTVVHVYNTPQPQRNDPFWMEFRKPLNPHIDDLGHGHGSIAFSRHTERIMPDLVNAVYDYFISISPKFQIGRAHV